MTQPRIGPSAQQSNDVQSIGDNEIVTRDAYHEDHAGSMKGFELPQLRNTCRSSKKAVQDYAKQPTKSNERWADACLKSVSKSADTVAETLSDFGTDKVQKLRATKSDAESSRGWFSTKRKPKA